MHLTWKHACHINIIYISDTIKQFILVLIENAGLGGNACWEKQCRHHLGRISLHILGNFRPGTHKSHISLEHINKLTDFIKPAFANQLANSCNAVVIFDGNKATNFIGVIDHCTELMDAKPLTVCSHSLLSVKYRSRRIYLYCNRQNYEYRRKNNQHDSRNNNIKYTLHYQTELLFTEDIVIVLNRLISHFGW